MARSFGPSCSMGWVCSRLRWRQEIGAALLVFFDPFLGEAAIADFSENLAHFFASLWQ